MEKPTVKKITKKPIVHKERKPRVAKTEDKVRALPAETKVLAGKYIEAIGRRKTAIARVRIFQQSGSGFVVNGKSLIQYFPDSEMQIIAKALRHGISRALILFSPDFRKRLKKAGFLTRDPRMRERKKFGLKRARKAPQWAKR